ncbi:hypothetical protein D3C79_489370 [compost metagenome]
MHDFKAVFWQGFHLDLHRILVTGQVVLSAITDPAQDGGLYLHQTQLLGELAGEHLFDEADLLLAANVVLFHGKYLFQTRWMWRFFNRLRTKFNIR